MLPIAKLKYGVILCIIQAIFVPMPPHIYGELTRTMEGCEILAKRKVVTDLLNRAHQLFNVCTLLPSAGRGATAADVQNNKAEIAAAYRDLQAALWALGHIGSNELGCALIVEADRKFIAWCIENVYSCGYYSLRGAFFYVLGLISRTQQGSRRLLKHGWDSSPEHGNSAVAFPLRPSHLFRVSGANSGVPLSPRNSGSPSNRFPFVFPPPTSPMQNQNRVAATGSSSAPTAGNPPAVAAPASAAAAGLNITTTGLSATLGPRHASMSPSHSAVMSPVRLNTLPEKVLTHLNVFNRASAAHAKNLELEVLHLIAKVRNNCLEEIGLLLR